jgi:cell division septal protein FtsQ
MGEAYRPLRRNESYNLPILRLPRPQLREALELLAALRQDEKRYHMLSEVLTLQNSWKLYFTHGRSWIVPRGLQAQQRISRLTALLQKPRWRKHAWRVDARSQTRWFLRPVKQEGVI